MVALLVISPTDWPAPMEAAAIDPSWLVATASLIFNIIQYFALRRSARAAAITQEQRQLEQQSFEREMEEARVSRGEAEKLARRSEQRLERARLVGAGWGNDQATSGDLTPTGEFGALIHNRTDTVVRFAHVTVVHRDRPYWVSKEAWGTLNPQSVTKWSARKIYSQARGDSLSAEAPPEEWEKRSAFEVAVSFVDGDQTFWLHDKQGVRELPSNLVVWAEETRAEALGRHIENGFTPEYGVSAMFAEFKTIQELQLALDALRSRSEASEIPIPDVIVGPHDWLGRVTLEDLVEEVHLPRSQEQSFHEKSLDALSRDGHLFAVPYVFDSVALIRNTELTGSGPMPATFEEAMRSGQALVGHGGVELPLVVQVGEFGDPYHLWPLFSSVGGTFFGLREDGGYDPPPAWRPAFVSAFRHIAELGEQGRGVLRRDIGKGHALSMFMNGRTPYLICSSRALGSIVERRLVVDVAPVPPLGDLPAKSMVSVYGFFIHKNGKNKRVAEDLVTHYLARTDTGERLVEIQPRPPVQIDASRRVAESDPHLAVYIRQCEEGIIMPTHPRMQEAWKALGRAQLDVIGGADPNAAAEQAADQGEEVLRETIR